MPASRSQARSNRIGLLFVAALLSFAAGTAAASEHETLTGALLPSWFKTYDASYQVSIETDTLTMNDGTPLAVTFFKPVPKADGERFPVVLEMLPYHKDDREYSDAELADLQEVIAKLAELPWSSGKIGMQGISWSAFNALMMAMRSPPALMAILVLHGSEDLYANDVHNIDGALHLDIFTQEMETANLLPRSPDYTLDDAYFTDRFDTEPWVINYLKHQRDGSFWRDGRSLFTAYDDVKVPIYTIGALLDGYRDYVINILSHVESPVKAEIGPWNHAFPDTGEPGPNYDFKQSAVRWWKEWLAGEDTGIMREPKFVAFLRGAIPATDDYAVMPGSFRSLDWPLQGQAPVTYRLRGDFSLSDSGDPAGAPEALKLAYRPAAGIAAGSWWGERAIGMPEAEDGTLVFKTEPFQTARYLIGTAKAHLKVSADAPQANWSVRLEDEHPDGSNSLITGGIANGTQHSSRLEPSPIPKDEPFELDFPLRFTTYTLEPGHRLRVVMSNAQFPMIWPTPYPMTTTLYVAGGASTVTIPIVDSIGVPADFLLKVQGPEATPADFAELGGNLGPAPVAKVSRDGSVVHAHQSESESFRMGGVTYEDSERSTTASMRATRRSLPSTARDMRISCCLIARSQPRPTS
jgi:putative CocE/NonD family hydrolase